MSVVVPPAVAVVAKGVSFASADPAVVAPVPPLAKARGVVESVRDGALTAPAKVAAPVLSMVTLVVPLVASIKE